MEEFYLLLCTMGLSQSMFFDGFNPNFDVISELPYEMSTTILRCLDGKTLLAAALVCRKWWRLIKSDGVLRRKVRDEFRARRMASLYFRPMGNRTGEFSGRIFGGRRKGVGVGGEGEGESVMLGRKRKFEKEISVINGVGEDGSRAETKNNKKNNKRKKVSVEEEGERGTKGESVMKRIFPLAKKSMKEFR